MSTKRLEGDVAVVTGAASGLDRGIALELAKHGATIAACDINQEGIEKTVRLIQEAGGEAFPVRIDVTDSGSVKDAMRRIYEKTGKITILINGAGIVRFSPIETCSDEEWDLVMRTNITGYFYCLREAYPYIKASGGGRIVQLSSTSAKSGSSFGGPHYTAAKGGVISLTKYAARRWCKDNIRVNTICPGIADTPMAHEPNAPDGSLDAMVANIPMGRICQPEDIAGGVMFLVSDESRYVTGITLDITGGRYVYGN